eukprot:TRINITY_DN839_c0_g1_i15.p1 TRINITY_DN839_c0_g1~~TRINITY_DN839_c0_g1_i15.p1  ORF type:complete len:422 (+),score=102.57 TRINITY_DN839_c0_g1_i15:129-1268(+)
MAFHHGRMLPCGTSPLASRVCSGDSVRLVPCVGVSPMLVEHMRGAAPALHSARCLARPAWEFELLDLQMILGAAPTQLSVDSNAAMRALCDQLDQAADVLSCVQHEIKQVAAYIKASQSGAAAGRPTMSAVALRSPALLAALCSVLAHFTKRNQWPVTSSRVHSFSASLETTPADAGQPQYLKYGRTIAPTLCISANEFAAKWDDHQHTCFAFDKESLAHSLTLAHCVKALTDGAAFVVIREPVYTMRLFQALSALGVDTKVLLDSGRATVLDSTCYTQDDPSPEALVQRMQAMCKGVLAATGAPALRVVGEPPFPAAAAPATVKQKFARHAVAYELQVDAAIRSMPVAALCLYNATAFPRSLMDATLHAHPTCVAAVW